MIDKARYRKIISSTGKKGIAEVSQLPRPASLAKTSGESSASPPWTADKRGA